MISYSAFECSHLRIIIAFQPHTPLTVHAGDLGWDQHLAQEADHQGQRPQSNTNQMLLRSQRHCLQILSGILNEDDLKSHSDDQDEGEQHVVEEVFEDIPLGGEEFS